FISAVGNDENGKELIEYLEKQDFTTQFIQQSALPTSTVTVELDDKKQATYTINKPVAWDDIELTDDLIRLVKDADVFVYCSLTCRSEKSRKTIYELLEHANLKIFDINLRAPHYEIETLKHLLAKADILKINEDELDYLKMVISLPDEENEMLKMLSKRFQLKLICLTLGDKGAKVFYNNEFYSHPGYPVKVVDTVGAGDSFLATFIAGYLQNLDFPTILDRACKVGAFVASQAGANPDYLDHLLK
ncbi:MAG: carbohydrate kinase, partial [Bacteroidetes bacterium]|nr:carbohydrate kinase [Bacteroidota bacterium]MBU1760911.1 carbohydrate kinase [Bacteroidota bacterium]